MKDMKLIMETWRKYSSQSNEFVFILEGKELVTYDLAHEFRLLRENHNNDRLNIIFEKWLVQTDRLLQENMVGNFFKGLKDKITDLSGQAKEAAMRFLKNPYLELSLQLWSFLKKTKDFSVSILQKIAKVGSRLNKARLEFKENHPAIYSLITIVVQIAVIMVVVYAIQHLLRAGLQAIPGSDTAPSRDWSKLTQTKIVGLPGGSTLDPAGEHQAATEFIVGFAKEAGHESLAQELARLAQSPAEVDYLSLKPELQRAINDGLVVINRAVEIKQDPALAPSLGDSVVRVAQQVAAEGREIFDNLPVR